MSVEGLQTDSEQLLVFVGNHQEWPQVVFPIPQEGEDGGVAPVPSGGEFITIPTQKTKDSDKMKATAEVIQCLIDGDNLKKTNDEMVYLAAKSDVRKQQVEENSAWAPWVDAVENAEGRTTDVGLQYEDISAQLSEDLQAALNKG